MELRSFTFSKLRRSDPLHASASGFIQRIQMLQKSFIIHTVIILLSAAGCRNFATSTSAPSNSTSMSQTEVTADVSKLASRMAEIQTPEDIVALRDLLFSNLEFRPYNERNRKHEEQIRWRRTASQIIEDGYVYQTKCCTDIVVVFLALCRAKGIEGHFVKVYDDRGRLHSMTEVKLPSGWYIFDAADTRTIPVAGRIKRDYQGWRLWRKGRDAWDIGLINRNSARKIYSDIYGEQPANVPDHQNKGGDDT